MGRTRLELWGQGLGNSSGRDGKSCRGRASPKCGPDFPGIGLFAVTCPGLAPSVQLADPSLKALLPRCGVLTASLTLRKAAAVPSLSALPGACQADPFFCLLALVEGPVTFFSLSHSSFKR